MNFRLRDLTAALVWGCAWAVVADQLSVRPAAVAAFAGGLSGFYLGGTLAGTRLRTAVVAAAVPVLLTLLLIPAALPARSLLLADALGPQAAYDLSSLLTWFLLSLAGVTLLKLLSTRNTAWVGLEVAIVVAFLASPFAAHREGFINRPHFLVDPLWSQGYDPVPILFALGAVAGAVVILLTIGRSTRRGSALDLALLLAVIGMLYLYLPENKIRDMIPEPKGGLGMTGDPKEGGPRGPQPPGERPNDGKPDDRQGEMPMQDNYEQGEQRPIAVVVLRDDYTPADGFFYFRQNAFSQFNGRRLVADTTGKADQDLAHFFPAKKTRINSLKLDENLFRPLKTRVALIAQHPQPFGLVTPMTVEPAPNPNPDQFERAYDVESMVPTAGLPALLGRRIGDPSWTQAQWDHYTRIPDDPRYYELARSVVDKLDANYAGDPLAQAVAVKIFLEKNGVYSLKSDHMNAEDPVASFLFGDKTGYCVHFAHAGVYLMRSLGLPARVGAGYMTDSRFRASGSTILLREGEAHAWPEVYFEGAGWVVVDIFPEKSLVEPMQQPDPGLQRMLGEMARDELERELPKPQKPLRERLREWAEMAFTLLALLAAVALLALYAGKVWRRTGPTRAGEDAVRATYVAALDSLADVGVSRAYGQGRQDFAQQVADRFPSLRPLTDYHLGRSLGRRPAPDRHSLLNHYGELKQEIRKATPAWRRLLGLLNPFSWISVK